MKKYLITLLISMGIISYCWSASLHLDHYFKDKSACFILYDINKSEIIKRYDSSRCLEQVSPESTFKIPLSLMVFDQEVIKQETIFKWDGKEKGLPEWNQDQTPRTWLLNSTVWVSQQLTPQLGLDKIKSYLKKFNYGNEDFSGEPGQNNGLTKAWLSSSLKISPAEQLAFLKNLVNDNLPVSKEAMAMTKENMYLETSVRGWQLYGKTGSGFAQQQPVELKNGWFIGFVKKADQTYIFVTNYSDLYPSSASETDAGGTVAKQITKKILKEMHLL